MLVRHSGDRVLAVSLLVQRPASLGQQDIDQIGAGARLVVVVGVRFGLVPGLGFGDLGLQPGDLGILVGRPGALRLKCRIGLGEAGPELVEFGSGSPAGPFGMWDERLVEGRRRLERLRVRV